MQEICKIIFVFLVPCSYKKIIKYGAVLPQSALCIYIFIFKNVNIKDIKNTRDNSTTAYYLIVNLVV